MQPQIRAFMFFTQQTKMTPTKYEMIQFYFGKAFCLPPRTETQTLLSQASLGDSQQSPGSVLPSAIKCISLARNTPDDTFPLEVVATDSGKMVQEHRSISPPGCTRRDPTREDAVATRGDVLLCDFGWNI